MSNGGHQPEASQPTHSVYPESAEGAISLSEAVILPEIAEAGPITFEEFMEIALYHEPGGYYTRPHVQRVGREGDFFTSISVGPAFGKLLAHRAVTLWELNGSPSQFSIVEPGPEEGQLAGDVLSEIPEISPECYRALTYHLIEPFESKHQALMEKISTLDSNKVFIHASSEQIPKTAGLVIANEILDALPVHLVEWSEGKWHERLVSNQNSLLSWTKRECQNKRILSELSPFSGNLPDGYQTEICLGYYTLLQSLMSSIKNGALLFFDYGFSGKDYYHPDRTSGTLQVYANHQASEDPFQAPGLCDLTTHVDFSRVLSAARALGLNANGFCTQESYLTSLATTLFSGKNSIRYSSPSFIRQFRTLTHPSLLGGRFHTLELSKGNFSCGKPNPTASRGLHYLENS